ncbi:hypothetical protein EBU24_04615 [bacterium]|nr:hypothetical protein [bacterium]
MSDKNLRSIVIDFTNDLTKVFPEYAFLWERWLTADDAEYEKLHQHFMAVFPERFFDIMNSNADIFKSESDLNVMFLPDVDFKLLFNCEGISENTKTSMWKYLQLLLFTVLGSVKDTANFGDTLNMFSSMDETDLQEKMKETMEGLGDFFKDFSPKAPAENSEEVPSGFKLPKPEIIQEHMKALMEGKLGKLAKELTEEFTGDLKDVFNENEDLSDKSLSDIMANLMKDPSKIMNIMKKITDKLQAKMKNGDISQDELMQEVAGLVEKFKSMGGGEDIMKKFTSGPFAKMFKNMAGGAGLNAMAQMGTQSAMKERLRKKMEDKKLKQAQAAAQAQASAQAVVSAQSPTNSFVVKIGEEKQEKSGLKAPLSDKELVDLFKNDKKDKKSKKGKK